MDIINRLREPSTMAGLAVLLGLFGVPAAPEIMQGVGHIVTGGFALAAVFMRENAAK